MCGIATIFAYAGEAPPVDEAELLRVRDHMALRGPDGSGIWLSQDRRVGLAHRRLAIIDLSDTGAQPMASADGRLLITFNGEIYNHRELRAGLEAQGCVFRSNSDTEVLLQLYVEKGPGMLQELRGMYAFAIWDSREGQLLLARDPFGVKPLYIADDGKTIRVASQVKALLAGGHVDTTPDPAGHVGFHLWGCVPEPYTLYRGIRSLTPGCYLTIDRLGRKYEKQFCSVTTVMKEAIESASELDENEIAWRLRETLLDSVRHHLVSDVPVGVFLSSGLDSTTLAALTAEVAPGSLHTVTLGFGEFTGTANDEVPLAEEVARIYGSRHKTVVVERKDFRDELPRMMNAMDQPSTDGVNSYFVCMAAARSGLKVVLSGLGGDELFGSYPGFRQIPRLVKWTEPFTLLPGIGRGFRLLSAPLVKHFTSPKYAGLLEYGGSYGGAYLLRRGMYMPWELPRLMDGDMVREGWRELQTLVRLEETAGTMAGSQQKVSALEMCWYMRSQLLRDIDWASMAHSLEVRVPFVDLELMRNLMPLLCSSRPVSKKDMAKTPRISLPEAVKVREKSGFFVPVREWMSEGLVLSGERSLRGWAKRVYAENGRGFRILVLVTDAFGGRGGIAKFNRDMLTALCNLPNCAEVVAITRLMPDAPEEMPKNLTYISSAVGSKLKYVRAVKDKVSGGACFDLVICAHINLLPLAYLCRQIQKAPLGLFIHGIEAWQPTGSPMTNALIKKIDFFMAVSDFTRKKFIGWTGLDQEKGHILPNCVDISLYGAGPKPAYLLERYHLQGKKVLMTLGRLVSHERYKGFDEILEILPELAETIPDVAYLIVGDGNDRQRLIEKADTLGCADRVVFTGFIPENEKADHYRLADVYVMPSRGEGFGIVYLEAMSCGIPVIASSVDGSREAVLNGELGTLVNPSDKKGIVKAIIETLGRSERFVPPGVTYFSFDNYAQRLRSVLAKVLRFESR